MKNWNFFNIIEKFKKIIKSYLVTFSLIINNFTNVIVSYMEGPISTTIDYLVGQPHESLNVKSKISKTSTIESDNEVSPVVEEESWKDWAYRHRYKIVGVLVAVGGVFAWWYLMGGGNPPPTKVTGAPGPSSKNIQNIPFKDLVKEQNEIELKNMVVDNWLKNKEVKVEHLVKEIKLPKKIVLLRENVLDKEFQEMVYINKFKENVCILDNKYQNVNLIMGGLTVQKEQMRVDSKKMFELANKYNLSDLEELLNEWSNFNDKAWRKLYTIKSWINSEINSDIASGIKGELSLEELDNLIKKLDLGYANCFDLIKQSGALYAKAELLYQDWYNKIYKGIYK